MFQEKVLSTKLTRILQLFFCKLSGVSRDLALTRWDTSCQHVAVGIVLARKRAAHSLCHHGGPKLRKRAAGKPAAFC